MFGHERITFEIELHPDYVIWAEKVQHRGKMAACPEEAKRVGKDEGFSPVPYSSATARCNSSAIFAGSLPA